MATIDDLTKLIEGQRGMVTGLGEQIGGAPAAFGMGEEIRERLTGSDYIKSIIKRIGEQKARLATIPAETRAGMPLGGFSPTQVSGLVAKEQEPVRAGLTELRGLREMETGNIADIIERATKGYSEAIEKQESKYQKEYQKLQDLIEEKRYLAETIESKRRFEEQMTLERAKVAPVELSTIDVYARDVIAGRITLSSVPDEIQAQVSQRMQELSKEIPAPPDYVSTFQQYKDADWTRESLEKEWLSQYNQGKTAGMQLKNVGEMNKEFPEIKVSLDKVYEKAPGWFGGQFRQMGEFFKGQRGPFELGG